MSGCCSHNTSFDGISVDYKRRLWAVIFINAAMFIIEMTSGKWANSLALQADALDFFGDALTYGISLLVIGMPLRARSSSAIFKGLTLFVVGIWILLSTAHQVLIPSTPKATVMGAIGLLAMAANLASVFLLASYRHGDSNVRSVWLCSRNDAIGNLAVILAAMAVAATASPWPDLVVAAIMAGLFLSSAYQILRQSLAEFATTSRAASRTN